MPAKSHGYTGTRLYNTWLNMKQRCFNPNYPRFKDYGGKGVSMCDKWKNSFETFMEWSLSNGYADNLTIDRKNNNGSYEPDNCQWITNEKQQLNRRNNRNITYNGTTMTMVEWSRKTGMGCKTIQKRIDSGWSIKEVFEIPRIKRGYDKEAYLARLKDGVFV